MVFENEISEEKYMPLRALTFSLFSSKEKFRLKPAENMKMIISAPSDSKGENC